MTDPNAERDVEQADGFMNRIAKGGPVPPSRSCWSRYCSSAGSSACCDGRGRPARGGRRRAADHPGPGGHGLRRDTDSRSCSAGSAAGDWAPPPGGSRASGFGDGRVAAVMAGTTEIAGGWVGAGLLTPLAAAGMIGVMTVAALQNATTKGFWSAGGGWELNYYLIAVAFGLAITGPGTLSLDAVAGWTWAGILPGWQRSPRVSVSARCDGSRATRVTPTTAPASRRRPPRTLDTGAAAADDRGTMTRLIVFDSSVLLVAAMVALALGSGDVPSRAILRRPWEVRDRGRRNRRVVLDLAVDDPSDPALQRLVHERRSCPARGCLHRPGRGRRRERPACSAEQRADPVARDRAARTRCTSRTVRAVARPRWFRRTADVTAVGSAPPTDESRRCTAARGPPRARTGRPFSSSDSPNGSRTSPGGPGGGWSAGRGSWRPRGQRRGRDRRRRPAYRPERPSPTASCAFRRRGVPRGIVLRPGTSTRGSCGGARPPHPTSATSPSTRCNGWRTRRRSAPTRSRSRRNRPSGADLRPPSGARCDRRSVSMGWGVDLDAPAP